MMSSLTMKRLVDRPQFAAQEFAVRAGGQRVEPEEAAGAFIARETFGREGGKLFFVKGFRPGVKGHDQPRVGLDLDIRYRRLGDAGMAVENRLDLHRRDADA